MGDRERGRDYLSWRDKGLSLDREERDMLYKQMAVYKRKGEKSMLG